MDKAERAPGKCPEKTTLSESKARLIFFFIINNNTDLQHTH
jgi:hypothetical protein